MRKFITAVGMFALPVIDGDDLGIISRSVVDA